MSPLERNIVDKIKAGGGTFMVLAQLVPAAEFRLVDKALQRLKRQGLIAWNRKRRAWEVPQTSEETGEKR